MRTFSKAFGLAWLRAGYTIGPARLIAKIEKSRGPYKVNAVAEAVATQVVLADGDWVAQIVEQIRKTRERL